MRKYILLAVASLAAVAAGSSAYLAWRQREPFPSGLIQANGRLEGDIVSIASKSSGRVQTLGAWEGDLVSAGQVLVRLEDAQSKARGSQAAHAVTRLDCELQAARIGLESLRKQVPLEIETAMASVEHARAMLAQAQVEQEHAQATLARSTKLQTSGSVSVEEHEHAIRDGALTVQEISARRSALVQAEKRLELARLGREQIRTRQSELAALEARRQEAAAALSEAESVVADLSIVAPASGVVITRMVHRGEVIAAGQPLMEIVDLDRLYLKVYIPEPLVGKLRLGLPARIHTDAFPEQPFDATVRYIASRAEFTPKEVQTVDERTKLIFATRLYLNSNPDRRLLPGMPADAMIRWEEGAPWAKPRW